MTLATLRSELLDQLRATDADLADVRLLRADAADDEHDPEGSTLSSDWSRISGLRSASVDQLAAIDAAIERVANGTYGICVRCGRPISAGRLEARPAADLCIDCARLL